MKYFAIHLYDGSTWICYQIKKVTEAGDFKGVGVIYKKNILKKVLKCLNQEDTCSNGH